MNTDPTDPGLYIVKTANKIGVAIRRYPFAIAAAFGILFLIIISPLPLYWWCSKSGKEWAEVIEHVFAALAVLAGLCAYIDWLCARMDRNTDVLIKLDEQFRSPELQAGKEIVEGQMSLSTNERSAGLDRLLRFYVLLCGVMATGEVPERALSISFRYWLAHYYYKDPDPNKINALRAYINKFYPTLKKWLLSDIVKTGAESFFRPHEFWDRQQIEANPDNLDPKV